MKLLLVLLFSIPVFASVEVTSLIGSPDMSLDFTTEFIHKEINLLDLYEKPEQEVTTESLYLVKLHGAEGADVVVITNEIGGSTSERISQGAKIGASRTKIVYTNLGPISNYYCHELEKMKENVFVMPAGNSGAKLDFANDPDCKAGNILFVTAYDQVAGDLFEQANYGPYIRLAAASRDIKTMGVGGVLQPQSRATLGQSIVVGKLSKFSREHPEWVGATLVEEFIKAQATKVEKIEGKIPGGLVILE